MARVLDGFRVLEIAEGTGGPMAAWFLAELGAEVCKVEPPQGDRLRGRPNFHVLNRGKRSLVLDPAVPGDRDRLDALLCGADACLIDETNRRAWALDVEALADEHPGLVLVHVPLYGSDGPFVDQPEDDDLLGALSGLFTTQLSYRKGPIYLTAPTASCAQAILAAQATLAGLYQRQSGARPGPIEVGGIRAAFSFQAGAYTTAPDAPPTPPRKLIPRMILPTYGYFQAQDGLWLFIGVLSPAQWVRLAACLGLDDFLADPALADGPMGCTDIDALERLQQRIENLFRTQPREHWLPVLADGDVASAPVASRDEYLREEQVHHMRMVVDIEDPERGPTKQMGTILRFSGMENDVPGAAPSLDPSAPAPDWAPRPPSDLPPATTLPLQGTTVVDLGTFIAGAYASTLLADLGAEILKLEPLDGDPWRQWGLGFFAWNRGKRSITVNLRDPAGHDAFLRLIARADAVVDNYRPGVTERLNITDDVLRAANPELVNVTVTSNGPDGPLAARPAFDQVFQARSGLSLIQGGGPDGEPVIHQVALNDHLTASVAALGTIAGLLARARGLPGPHGQNGYRAQTSLLQNTMAVTAGEFIQYEGRPEIEYLPPEPYGRRALRRAYQCADDGWLFLAASREGHWPALREALPIAGAEPGSADSALAERSDGALAATLESAFGTIARDDAIARLHVAGVPAVPCPEPAEIFAGETTLANRGMTVVETASFGRVAHCTRFARFGDLDPDPRPAPELGADSRAILIESSFSPTEIEALFAEGVTTEPVRAPA